MNKITSKSHVYRLIFVLAIGFTCFMVIRSYAVPASWNFTVWYRGDNQKDLKELPVFYGGNDSCQSCHEDISIVGAVTAEADDDSDDFEDEFFEEEEVPVTAMVFEHKTLSCESCHGPLGHHARGEEKIGDAVVMDDSNWQCMNCHANLISRPVAFPKFTLEVEKHQEMTETTLCMKCHDPHNPIEDEVAVEEEELDFGDEL